MLFFQEISIKRDNLMQIFKKLFVSIQTKDGFPLVGKLMPFPTTCKFTIYPALNCRDPLGSLLPIGILCPFFFKMNFSSKIFLRGEDWIGNHWKGLLPASSFLQGVLTSELKNSDGFIMVCLTSGENYVQTNFFTSSFTPLKVQYYSKVNITHLHGNIFACTNFRKCRSFRKYWCFYFCK